MIERLKQGTAKIKSCISKTVERIDKAFQTLEPDSFETFLEKVRLSNAVGIRVVPFTRIKGVENPGGHVPGMSFIPTRNDYSVSYEAYSEAGKVILETEERFLVTKYVDPFGIEGRNLEYRNILSAFSRLQELKKVLPNLKIELLIPVNEGREGPKVDKARLEKFNKAIESGLEPFPTEPKRRINDTT